MKTNRRCFLGGLLCGGAGGGVLGWFSAAARSHSWARSTPPAELPHPYSQLDHSVFMRQAITEARQIPARPFGAVIVDAGTAAVVARGHNRTDETPTFHGEIDAINHLAKSQFDRAGRSLALYTTAEPCPMCQAAIGWAGLGLVVYGASIPFLRDLGWWQIDVRAEELARRTPFRNIKVVGGVLEEECNALFPPMRR